MGNITHLALSKTMHLLCDASINEPWALSESPPGFIAYDWVGIRMEGNGDCSDGV